MVNRGKEKVRVHMNVVPRILVRLTSEDAEQIYRQDFIKDHGQHQLCNNLP